MQDEPLSTQLLEVETTLAGLRPRAATIGRDRLMFLAGAASRRRPWLWMAASFLLAVGLACAVALRPAPMVVERVVFIAQAVPQAAPVPSVASAPSPSVELEPLPRAVLGDQSYLRLRQAVLERGLDALPASRAVDQARDDPKELLQQLLSGNGVL